MSKMLAHGTAGYLKQLFREGADGAGDDGGGDEEAAAEDDSDEGGEEGVFYVAGLRGRVPPRPKAGAALACCRDCVLLKLPPMV